MRFFWRTDSTPLTTYSAWIDEIDPKNRSSGTSAPTIAAAWSGPLDLLGALATEPALAGLRVDRATVEARAVFDDHGGNSRNHDLVLRAVTSTGEAVVVCVEAKAGETLGDTVAQQVKTAQKAKDANDRSKASARLEDLVARLCRHPIDDERTGLLRYQLLTAWAGTLTDAAEAAHAVLAVHEFCTDERPDDRTAVTHAELARFAEVVLDCELPAADAGPWCVRVPDVEGVSAALYVAHTMTDLRTSLLSSL